MDFGSRSESRDVSAVRRTTERERDVIILNVSKSVG